MEQSINYKLKIDSSNILISQPMQNKDEPKYKRKVYEKCNQCNKRRRPLEKSHKICRICYKSNILYKSENKVVDDFIRYTQINSYLELKFGKMEFVPYNQFENIVFIAEGGFSKVYRATWIDGPTINWDKEKLNFKRNGHKRVALKKLNNSENITSKELNEVYNLIIIYFNVLMNFY